MKLFTWVQPVPDHFSWEDRRDYGDEECITIDQFGTNRTHWAWKTAIPHLVERKEVEILREIEDKLDSEEARQTEI